MPDVGLTARNALRGAIRQARLAVRLARKGEAAKARKARSDSALCLRYAVGLATLEHRQSCAV